MDFRVTLLKLKIVDRMGWGRLQTTVGAGKFIEQLIKDAKSSLLNIDERSISSIPLLENCTWHMLSGSILVILGNCGLYSLDLVLSRAVLYHCIYLKWDSNLKKL